MTFKIHLSLNIKSQLYHFSFVGILPFTLPSPALGAGVDISLVDGAVSSAFKGVSPSIYLIWLLSMRDFYFFFRVLYLSYKSVPGSPDKGQKNV